MRTDDEIIAALRSRVADATARSNADRSSRPRAVVTDVAVAEAERQLGYLLHPLLRRVLLEVANGGIGPGYGMLGITSGRVELAERTIVSGYHEFREPVPQGFSRWPEGVLPLWDWGDAMWSCIDAMDDAGRIITCDSAAGATVTEFTVQTWLEAWLDEVDLWAELYEPGPEATIINPFTREPTTIRACGRPIGVPLRR